MAGKGSVVDITLPEQWDMTSGSDKDTLSINVTFVSDKSDAKLKGVNTQI